MKFDHLKNSLNAIKCKRLSGTEAHKIMMGTEVRADIFKKVRHTTPVKEAAVMALLYPDKANLTRLVMILRKTYNGHHSGQISFPGGKREAFDADLWHTALRETNEEIGILPEKIQYIRHLTPVFIPISNFRVQPFLAFAKSPLQFEKDPYEVEEILELPIKSLLTEPLVSIKHSYFGQTYQLKAFQVGQIKIWGASAMILSEITALLNKL